MLEDVRAVGASLTARVPELIEDFYGWLTRRSEFGQFMSSEQLLARVKGQQAEYWRDFLRAEVDEAYVERRRVVGLAHARIELGLLIYLQAMEFVSAWLRREIEADERLRCDRPNATFSIRKRDPCRATRRHLRSVPTGRRHHESEVRRYGSRLVDLP